MFYYLFTVGVEDIHSKQPGKFYLDTFLSYSEKEKQNVIDAYLSSKNELIPLSTKDALEMFECKGLTSMVNAISIRSVWQNTMICLVNSELELTREDIDIVVKTSRLEDIQKMAINYNNKSLKEGGEI